MAHHFLNIQNSYPPFRRGGKTAFFCHSSYESRTLASMRLSEGLQGVDTAFVLHSDDFLESETYRHNHIQLVQYFGSISTNDPVQIPMQCGVKDGMLDTCSALITESLNRADDIAIDITTFNRGRMIYLLNFILMERGNKPLYLFYTEPEKYGTEKNGKRGAWLTKGVKNIVSVPGFQGDKQENRESLLVLLLGYDSERAVNDIEAVNPDKIVVLSQGTLKCRRGLQEVYLKSYSTVLERYADRIVNILTVPPYGWEAVYDVLTRIYALYKNQFNMSAILHGTKMQVFGAVTFCQKNPNIELIYVEPEKYNCEAFTQGVGQTWWLDVPDMSLFKKR